MRYTTVEAESQIICLLIGPSFHMKQSMNTFGPPTWFGFTGLRGSVRKCSLWPADAPDSVGGGRRGGVHDESGMDLEKETWGMDEI